MAEQRTSNDRQLWTLYLSSSYLVFASSVFCICLVQLLAQAHALLSKAGPCSFQDKKASQLRIAWVQTIIVEFYFKKYGVYGARNEGRNFLLFRTWIKKLVRQLWNPLFDVFVVNVMSSEMMSFLILEFSNVKKSDFDQFLSNRGSPLDKWSACRQTLQIRTNSLEHKTCKGASK